MLYDKFITQVRVSVSAPVQMERGGLGMVNVARAVMLGVSTSYVLAILLSLRRTPTHYVGFRAARHKSRVSTCCGTFDTYHQGIREIPMCCNKRGS